MHIKLYKTNLIKGISCHYGMMCPQVADGGDTLQIWRVTVNISNKKSWTTGKDGPPV
jgi:hypothetical protein